MIIRKSFALLLAAAGATTIAAAPAVAAPFTVEPVASFASPWAMTFLPDRDSQALVTEKGGALWLVDVVTGQRQQVGGVPAVRVAGQGGLGDVITSRTFASDRRVYLSFVEAGGDGTSGAAIGYGTLVTDAGVAPRLDAFRIIWRQSPKVSGDRHFSHRMLLTPTNYLFVTSGDRQKFTPSQDLTGNLGKVLRLTPEGLPATYNPWASLGGVAREFWSIGHRNMLGIARTGGGQIYVAEMGPLRGDELNLVKSKRNYGWPLVSDGDNYDGSTIPDHSTRPEFEKPVKSYPSETIAPAGLIFYGSNRYVGWKGSLLMGGLAAQTLIRFKISNGRATETERFAMGARVREVELAADGIVYLLEDSGRLVRLKPAP